MRRANEAGVECRQLGLAERQAILHDLTARKERTSDRQERRRLRLIGRPFGSGRPGDEAAGWFSHADDEWWAAVSPDGVSLALASICVDKEWALLRALISVEYPARYLLHLRLVEELAGRGLRFLWTAAPNAMLQARGLQFFQYMLGYEIVNLAAN
ncbi:MAG: hypothetical protein ACR2GZ_03820 [Solirubrobacteraceae bacterium]